MDEWHQLQAVANTFRYGTPNTEGSANGTMFHFLFSGLYLIPFMLFKIIDPFSLQIDNLFMRERVFEVLRLQSIILGILSIFTIYKIAGLINISKKLAIFLFTFTPILLMLSGYFKYDISLVLWMLISLYFLLRFAKDPTNRNYILASIPCSLAIAVKISAIPLLIIYLFSYFWFQQYRKKNIKYLFLGTGIFIIVLFLFGLPDTLFGKGNIIYYLFNNIIENQQSSSNINIGINQFIYLLFIHYPLMFGHSLVYLFFISILIMIFNILKNVFNKNTIQYKIDIFLLVGLFLFYSSLLTIKLGSAGNRTLVLLPFIVLITVLVLKQITIIAKMKQIITSLIIIVIILQIYESFAWTYMKMVKSPQKISSDWIEKNIKKGETVGLENIPIYQLVPDIIQKEFYFNQYGINKKNNYVYKIIDNNSKKFPETVIITNVDIDRKLFRDSPKKYIINRLEGENYKKITFSNSSLAYIKILGSNIDYYISGIVTSPLTITVYIK